MRADRLSFSARAYCVFNAGQSASRREIGLKFKGWDVETALSAKGEAEAAKDPPGGRNVSIGGDATRVRIMTGDAAPATKPAAAQGRNVSIGGRAEGNTIVTGDGSKIG